MPQWKMHRIRSMEQVNVALFWFRSFCLCSSDSSAPAGQQRNSARHLQPRVLFLFGFLVLVLAWIIVPTGDRRECKIGAVCTKTTPKNPTPLRTYQLAVSREAKIVRLLLLSCVRSKRSHHHAQKVRCFFLSLFGTIDWHSLRPLPR